MKYKLRAGLVRRNEYLYDVSLFLLKIAGREYSGNGVGVSVKYEIIYCESFIGSLN